MCFGAAPFGPKVPGVPQQAKSCHEWTVAWQVTVQAQVQGACSDTSWRTELLWAGPKVRDHGYDVMAVDDAVSIDILGAAIAGTEID